MLGKLGWGVALLAACGLAGAAWGKGNAQAGQEKALACGACHGTDGNSLNPEWPSLAGQIPDYLKKQLFDFKLGHRADPLMSPMALPLAPQDIEDLATYFSGQAAKEPALQARNALGERLYLKGKLRPQATACIGCHGPAGAGNAAWGKTLAAPPAVLAPAIGGQQAPYLAKQLKAYRDGTRKNDAAQVMRNIAASLNDQEIAALADYIAALKR
ncbi:cytochrome subunit of sulfide dehydrogenase [Burkholderiales bacterium]|nr:cytochrome subunit of sulfide dehydrogenase [Burkholderiales bacterium]